MKIRITTSVYNIDTNESRDLSFYTDEDGNLTLDIEKEVLDLIDEVK